MWRSGDVASRLDWYVFLGERDYNTAINPSCEGRPRIPLSVVWVKNMYWFFISVILVLVTWAGCSLLEAAIYAVRVPYVRHLAESGSRSGRILSSFKENMEQPVSAILVVNTAVSAGGAAVVGAQARDLFGESSLVWFSIFFTVSALVISEIIPKLVGVRHNRVIAKAAAAPLSLAVTILRPITWLMHHLARGLNLAGVTTIAPEEEVHQMASISAEEGSIMQYEAKLVSNVLNLDQVHTADIMTPRPVVVKLPDNLTLRETHNQLKDWTFSRIPIYSASDPETWTGFILSRDVLDLLAKGDSDRKLTSVCKPLYFVSEKTPGHVLLRAFLKRRSHLFGVIDEYGDVSGIVTLEDVLESLIGEEIVDELDTAIDLQEVARLRKREHYRDSRVIEGKNERQRNTLDPNA